MLSVSLADLVTDAFAFTFSFSISISIAHVLVCLVIGARRSFWWLVGLGHSSGKVRVVEVTYVALAAKRGIQIEPFGWPCPAMFLLV